MPYHSSASNVVDNLSGYDLIITAHEKGKKPL
jgi:hypothetical protein